MKCDQTALPIVVLLSGVLVSCGSQKMETNFKISVLLTQDAGFSQGEVLDSGLRSLGNYYSCKQQPKLLLIPTVSIVRADLNEQKAALDVPMLPGNAIRAKWLGASAAQRKQDYDKLLPKLPTPAILVAKSNTSVDADALLANHPGALFASVMNGKTTGLPAIRDQIEKIICEDQQKNAFEVILRPPTSVIESPAPQLITRKPPPVVPVITPKPKPVAPAIAPRPKPVAPVITHNHTPAPPPVTTPKLPPVVSVVNSGLPPAPPKPDEKPCYTIQVFSVDQKRPEDNPITDGQEFREDDPTYGLLSKGSLRVKTTPCRYAPEHKEVRVTWVRDGKDYASPALTPEELRGETTRPLLNFPLPGTYQVAVEVNGVVATEKPFGFKILPRLAKSITQEPNK